MINKLLTRYRRWRTKRYFEKLPEWPEHLFCYQCKHPIKNDDDDRVCIQCGGLSRRACVIKYDPGILD